MTREMERELDRLGVIERRAKPEPRPAPVAAWRPEYPGEEPPF